MSAAFFQHEACSAARPFLCGWWPVGPAGLHRVHFHDSLEVLWPLRRIAVRVGPGAMVPVPPGSVVVVAPMQPHFVDEDDAPRSRRLAGCHLAIRDDLVAGRATAWRSGVLPPDQARVLHPLLDHVRRRWAESPGRAPTPDLIGMVRGLLHLLRDLGWEDRQAAGAAGDPPPVMASLDLIARRWSDPALGVADLAAAAGLGAVRFRQVFAKHAGVAPSLYLDRLRIDHARRLLGEGRLTAAAVAAACGFGSASAFYRCYKRLRGCPPGADTPLARTPAALSKTPHPVP